ncbi:hypothetical protein NBH00_00625 [Paraconexibacter antarcticus]|uniref:PASTA domain-containing protein n=1 Tax=Paraconexibacter antarcticus TaxID=2949664 RepID=A0ABY5DT09_9ACTN|nr:hypothetical protein [Paraconexibacter antarcticus]UTI64729.1 hypothetical protein NBH00_00625 [Paraconexibacter antarcticus]
MNALLRRLALPVALCGGLLGPAAASAVVTTTHITAPDDLYAPAYDWLDGAGPNVLRVAGTTGGGYASGDAVDIICVRRGEPLTAAGTAGSEVAAPGVPVTAAGAGTGTFAVAIDATAPALRTPCRLRAIPTGALTYDQAAFAAGPAIFPSGLRDLRETVLTNPNVGELYDVDASTVTPSRTSTAHLQSFGGCGLWDARPLDPAVGPDVAALDVFECAGYADDVADGTAPTRSELQVDGRNAFTAAMAANGSGGLPAVGGRPPLTRTASRDPATGLLTVTESSDVVRCETTPASYPFAAAADCGSLVPAGLRLVREAVMSDDGRVTTMRDRWESTDGASHVLDLLFEVDFASTRYGLQLPWAGSGIAAYPGSASLAAPPSAPASILVRSDRAFPAGDIGHPTGAITFSTAPTSIEFISGLGDPSRYLELHYLQPVTAAAPLNLTHTFSMAPDAATSAALAARAEDSYGSPAVAFTSPAPGAAVRTPTVTVTGTATDNRAVTALTVAGQPTAPGAGGAWSAVVPLVPGTNAIVAHATDAAGDVTEATLTIIYRARAAPKPCVVPKVRGLKSAASAGGVLRRAGCRRGRTLTVYSRPRLVRKGRKLVRVVVRRFTVLGSKQRQGRRLPAGTKVDLIVQGRRPRTAADRKAAAKQQAAARKPPLPVYHPGA